MPLQTRVDRIEGVELLDGEISPHCQHGIESDGRVPLTQYDSVSIGKLRFAGIDMDSVEVEVGQNIGDRQRTANMTGACIEDCTQNEFACAGG